MPHAVDARLDAVQEQLGRVVVQVLLDLLGGHARIHEEAHDIEQVQLFERVVAVAVAPYFLGLEQADLVIVHQKLTADVAHLGELAGGEEQGMLHGDLLMPPAAGGRFAAAPAGRLVRAARGAPGLAISGILPCGSSVAPDGQGSVAEPSASARQGMRRCCMVTRGPCPSARCSVAPRPRTAPAPGGTPRQAGSARTPPWAAPAGTPCA